MLGVLLVRLGDVYGENYDCASREGNGKSRLISFAAVATREVQAAFSMTLDRIEREALELTRLMEVFMCVKRSKSFTRFPIPLAAR